MKRYKVWRKVIELYEVESETRDSVISKIQKPYEIRVIEVKYRAIRDEKKLIETKTDKKIKRLRWRYFASWDWMHDCTDDRMQEYFKSEHENALKELQILFK